MPPRPVSATEVESPRWGICTPPGGSQDWTAATPAGWPMGASVIPSRRPGLTAARRNQGCVVLGFPHPTWTLESTVIVRVFGSTADTNTQFETAHWFTALLQSCSLRANFFIRKLFWGHLALRRPVRVLTICRRICCKGKRWEGKGRTVYNVSSTSSSCRWRRKFSHSWCVG